MTNNVEKPNHAYLINNPTPEMLVFNWARDFIILHTKSSQGFCSEKDFKRTFEMFKKSYNYTGDYKHILKQLKKDRYINKITGEIKWNLL